MTLRIIRRVQARRDVDAAALWYATEAGLSVAERFVGAVETALHRAAQHPAAGSLRYADAALDRQLRFWPVRGFPYLLFYVERTDYLDVWRVLHAERDLPAWLRAED